MTHTEYMREWRARPENAERIKAAKRASYARNRAKLQAYWQAYYETHKEERLRLSKARRDAQRAADPTGYALRQREAGRKRNAAHPERQREIRFKHHLKDRYGLSLAEYRARVTEQHGCCLICGVERGERLVVDHDHRSGRVRGLLCSACNHFLGFAGDDIGRLEAGIAYLRRLG